MTFVEFCCAVRVLCKEHGFSVTSWGRTVAHNAKEGGVPTSWHLDFMAVDAVPDAGSDRVAFKSAASALGFDVVDEGDHVHLEPRGPRFQTDSP